MTNEQKFVRDFHMKYGCPSQHTPKMISEVDRMHRARLIISEASEFLEACDKGDFVEMVDALVDLQYVLLGTAVELGVDLEPVFNNVHESNMSKNGGKDSGGKVLKGPGFVPPDIKSVLKAQGWSES